MAGDWIKIRGSLLNSPKLIRISRELHENREFRDWLTPGGGGELDGQIISDSALRCVTLSLLCVTWSWSREYGKTVGDDCFLPCIDIDDIDSIAGVSGLGRAMEAVGWAEKSDDDDGVVLPKFFTELNVPLTNAEKQRAYRQRKKSNQNVTENVTTESNKAVTRGEERRGDSNKESKPKKKSARFVKPTLADVAAYCQERGNTIDPERFIDHYESNGWKVGKNSMKDWRASVRQWEKTQNDQRTATAETNRAQRTENANAGAISGFLQQGEIRQGGDVPKLGETNS